MLYSGVSLTEESEPLLSVYGMFDNGLLILDPFSFFLVPHSEVALSTLASIHDAGMLHGDVRKENILVGDAGVTLIDFSHSTQCDDQRVKDQEYGLFCYLLGLEDDSDSE